jgi:hypothetical protein
MRAALNAVTLARGLSPLKAAEVTAAAGFSSIGMWYDAVHAFEEKEGSLDKLLESPAMQSLLVEEICFLGGWMWATGEARETALQAAEDRAEMAAAIGSCTAARAGANPGRCRWPLQRLCCGCTPADHVQRRWQGGGRCFMSHPDHRPPSATAVTISPGQREQWSLGPHQQVSDPYSIGLAHPRLPRQTHPGRYPRSTSTCASSPPIAGAPRGSGSHSFLRQPRPIHRGASRERPGSRPAR